MKKLQNLFKVLPKESFTSYIRNDFRKVKIYRDLECIEFFCVPLFTDYLFDLHKKFQVVSSYGAIKNTRFGVTATICFSVLLIIDRHIQSHTQTNR